MKYYAKLKASYGRVVGEDWEIRQCSENGVVFELWMNGEFRYIICMSDIRDKAKEIKAEEVK